MSFSGAGLWSRSALGCVTQGSCPASEPQPSLLEEWAKKGSFEVLGEASVGEPHPSWGLTPQLHPGQHLGPRQGPLPWTPGLLPPRCLWPAGFRLPHPGWAPPPSSRTRGLESPPVTLCWSHLSISHGLRPLCPSPHLHCLFLRVSQPHDGDNMAVSAGRGMWLWDR